MSAQSHGRVAMALCGAKLVLCLCLAVVDTAGAAVYITVVTMVGVCQLVSVVKYVPYYHDRMNTLTTTAAMMFLWAAFTTDVGYLRRLAAAVTHSGSNDSDGKTVEDSEQVEAFLFLFALPVVAFSGYAIGQQRLTTLATAAAAMVSTGSLGSGNASRRGECGGGVAGNLNACVVELYVRRLLTGVLADGGNASDDVNLNAKSAHKKQRRSTRALTCDVNDATDEGMGGQVGVVPPF